jgi:hypothetical protein
MSAGDDPVRARRARIARGVALAKRVGYSLLLAAVVLFVAAAAASFPSGLVTASIVALVAACIVLPVPIVLGYGLRAAEREDRERGLAGPSAAPRPGEERRDDER